MNTTEYVVWGARADYAGGTPIKLMGGTGAQCRAECNYRRALGGWTLGTFREGVMPPESWLDFARKAAWQGRTTCTGCFRIVAAPTDHAHGCPTGQNGSPNYN